MSPLATIYFTQQTFHLDTGVDIQFVEIPSGSFVMGSGTQIDRLSFDNELPPHTVDVNKYWMCKYPITNLLYKIFIDETRLPPPSNWMEDGIPQGLEHHPVVFVNWFDASTFCEWLSHKINASVCLPSEAEWEMAARLEYRPNLDESWREESFHLNVNYDRYYLSRGTTAVAQNIGAENLQSGCSDMLGNVWEWTSDWYDKSYYIKSSMLNPIGPESGVCRAIRGGSWADDYGECRVQARQGFNPVNRNSYTGFRCCISNTHANTYKDNSQIRFLLGKSIYQRAWGLADQLLEKWGELYPEDPSIIQFQFLIAQLKGKKQNQGHLEELKIHSLQLQIASAIHDENWEQVVSNSSELIKLTKYNKVAADALLLAHQYLDRGKIKILQSNLCLLIELRRKELIIEQLLINKNWENARKHVLELQPWSTIKTEITKKLKHIDAQIQTGRQKSIFRDESKGMASSKSQEELFAKFKQSLLTKNWKLVVQYGEEWLAINPNISSVRNLVENAKTQVQGRKVKENKIQASTVRDSETNQGKADTLTQLRMAVDDSSWGQSLVLAEEWVIKNLRDKKKSPSDVSTAVESSKYWKKYSSQMINLVAEGVLLNAVIVASICIYFSPAKVNADTIMNTIWNKSKKLGILYCSEAEYKTHLDHGEWYKLLHLMLTYLSAADKSKPKTEDLQKNKLAKTIREAFDKEQCLELFNLSASGQKNKNAKVVTISPLENLSLSFARIPDGNFRIGGIASDSNVAKEELPASIIHLPTYWIGETPITISQFTTFVEKTGYITTAEKKNIGYSRFNGKWSDFPGVNWKHPYKDAKFDSSKFSCPVTMVSWFDAQEFCNWFGNIIGLKVELPSEAEWEKAARGGLETVFPWGNYEISRTFCNFANREYGDVTPVGIYTTKSIYSYGCKDMAGNVWELTRSKYKNYPYVVSDGREDSSGLEKRVIRGGAFVSPARDLRCSARKQMESDQSSSFIGFRIAIRKPE